MTKIHDVDSLAHKCSVPHGFVVETIEQLGGWDDETLGTLEDIARGGADAGWPGFTYYSDTTAFVERVGRKALTVWADEFARDVGYASALECFRKSPCGDSDATLADIVEPTPQWDCFLAWLLLEEVARATDC